MNDNVRPDKGEAWGGPEESQVLPRGLLVGITKMRSIVAIAILAATIAAVLFLGSDAQEWMQGHTIQRGSQCIPTATASPQPPHSSPAKPPVSIRPVKPRMDIVPYCGGRGLGGYDSESEDSDDTEMWENPTRYDSKVWLRGLDYRVYDVAAVPPTDLVYHTDLLEEGWGWQRLMPYIEGNVDWTVFEDYLQQYFIRSDGEIAGLCANEKPEKDMYYFRHNATKLASLHKTRKSNRDEGKPSCDVINNKSDVDGQSIASDYILDAAATLCIETEIMYCVCKPEEFTDEEINLSDQIKKCAKHVIHSAVEYPIAAAALVCIGKENTLLLELMESSFDTTPLITLSNQIKKIASTLMLYKGPATVAVAAAAAGAMVGLAKEAKFLCYVMTREDYIQEDYDLCHYIRSGTILALMRLQESICDTSGNGDAASAAKTDEPQGDLDACCETDRDA